MSGEDRSAAAYMELTPDAWHQNQDGNYYIDCPECGSAASLMNVVKHGRCNGYLDQREDETEYDEETVTCTAKLWFELGYDSDVDEATDVGADTDAESATEGGTDGDVESEPDQGSDADA